MNRQKTVYGTKAALLLPQTPFWLKTAPTLAKNVQRKVKNSAHKRTKYQAPSTFEKKVKGRINWVTVINVPIFNRVYVATNDPNLEASFYANIDCEARKERSSITMATAYTNQYFGVYRQYAAAATWSHEMVHVIMAWLKRNEVSCRETPAYLMEYLMAAHSVLESALKKNTRVDHDHARLVWVRRYPAGVQALKAAQRFVKENALYVETFKGKTIHWKQTVRPLKGGHDK